MFPSLNRAHFVYPFVLRWAVGLLPLLALVGDAAVNVGVQVSARVWVLWDPPASGSAGSRGDHAKHTEDQPDWFPHGHTEATLLKWGPEGGFEPGPLGPEPDPPLLLQSVPHLLSVFPSALPGRRGTASLPLGSPPGDGTVPTRAGSRRSRRRY